MFAYSIRISIQSALVALALYVIFPIAALVKAPLLVTAAIFAGTYITSFFAIFIAISAFLVHLGREDGEVTKDSFFSNLMYFISFALTIAALSYLEASGYTKLSHGCCGGEDLFWEWIRKNFY